MGDITLDDIVRLYKQDKIDKKTAEKLIYNKRTKLGKLDKNKAY